MSGIRGAAHKNKIKLKAQVLFFDTGRTVQTNIFIARSKLNPLAVVALIEAKYGKPLSVVSVSHKGQTGSKLFVEPKRLAA